MTLKDKLPIIINQSDRNNLQETDNLDKLLEDKEPKIGNKN